jgi:O-antigen/teichoic acid export membrane protein
VLVGFGLPAMAAGWCTTQVAVVAASALRLPRRFPEAMPRRLAFGGTGSAKGYIARAFWVAVSQTAQVLLNGTDVIIIGALLGPAAVVPYACTGKLISVLANQPQAILQSAAPALSELRPSGDRARMFQVSAALSQATLAVSGLVACVVLAVNQGFVTWWVGPDQFAGLPLTLLMLAAMLIRHFNTTNVYALFCFGHERRLALTALADGLVTIGAGVGLVAAFGMAGGALASLAGVALISTPLNLRALSVETGVDRRLLLASLGPWAIRFALVAGITGMLGVLVRPSTFAMLAVLSSGAAALYAVAVLTPLLKSPAGIYLQPIITSIGRRLTPARLRPSWLG